MAKITKISQQIKRPDRFSIYVDETYSFSLNDYQLAASGLRVGKEFTARELDELVQESNFGKAYERALNYVTIRPRSQKEIKDYLVRTFLYPKAKMYKNKLGEAVFKKIEVDKEKTTNMIERVLQRLDEKGYINDESFAKAWIASRQYHKKPSRRKLEQELRVKGIDQEIIATLLQNTEETEKANLLELANKKRRLVRYQDEQKLTAYLLRQGFNYDDVKEVLDGTERS